MFADDRKTYRELDREQGAVENRLDEARRFIEEANRASGNQNYRYAFELLAQSSNRLARSDSRLEDQIDEIANMRWAIFTPRDAREVLENRRRELRGTYFEVNRRAQELSRDLAPRVGVDLERAQWMLGALRFLSENAADPAVRERAGRLLRELENALEQGNIEGIQRAMEQGERVVSEGRGDLQREGRDPDGPQARVPPPGQDDLPPPSPAVEEETPFITPGEAEPQPRPDHLHEETVSWLMDTLDKLCREIQDPELRARICQVRDELQQAVERGDWNRVSDILNETVNEIIPEVNRREPAVGGGIPDMPVLMNGEVEYFPPDFSKPGVGTRYVGGRGARLIEEIEEFIELAGQGAEARFRKRQGDSRRWGFEAAVTREESVADGRRYEFRLNESRRDGRYELDGWRVLGPDGAPVAEGTGETGSVEIRESGAYTIEFTGKTDWDSPFRIETRINVAL